MSEFISREAFAALVADRGLNLTPERFEELREAYAHVAAMRKRLLTPRGYDAEPAAVFQAGAA